MVVIPKTKDERIMGRGRPDCRRVGCWYLVDECYSPAPHFGIL